MHYLAIPPVRGVVLTLEQRETVRVLVRLRWLMLATAVFVVDYQHGTTPGDWVALNTFVVAGAGMNALMHWQLRTERPIPLALPLGTSLYDAAAVTGAIALVDGFGNPSFLLYYPAVLGYSVAFPGRFSLAYCLAVMVAYGLIAPPLHGRFDWSSETDLKSLVLRLTTIGVVAVAANLIVRVERERRERAVANEAQRAEEVRRLERERTTERQRLLHDVHDGIAQSVYMMSLGLEAAAKSEANSDDDPAMLARLNALTDIAKRTLLETRGLLFDLAQVTGGETGLVGLTTNLAGEFEAISGIHSVVEVSGDEPELAPATVSEVFRLVQGAVGNVQRHSEASEMRIALVFGEGSISIEVSDNGRGFDAASEYGVGRRAMESRAARLGGSVKTDSRTGSGTIVRLTVPLGRESGAS